MRWSIKSIPVCCTACDSARSPRRDVRNYIGLLVPSLCTLCNRPLSLLSGVLSLFVFLLFLFCFIHVQIVFLYPCLFSFVPLSPMFCSLSCFFWVLMMAFSFLAVASSFCLGPLSMILGSPSLPEELGSFRFTRSARFPVPKSSVPSPACFSAGSL